MSQKSTINEAALAEYDQAEADGAAKVDADAKVAAEATESDAAKVEAEKVTNEEYT